MNAEAREARMRERFWKRVVKTATCWLWQGATDKDGYGRVWYNGFTCRAHRIAYEWVYGPTNLFLLHQCDTPACVRPDHLFKGTQADNIADAYAKGRKNDIGEANGFAKLNPDLVREIRRRAVDESQLDLAREFGINYSHLSEVVNRKVWTHVI